MPEACHLIARLLLIFCSLLVTSGDCYITGGHTLPPPVSSWCPAILSDPRYCRNTSTTSRHQGPLTVCCWEKIIFCLKWDSWQLTLGSLARKLRMSRKWRKYDVITCSAMVEHNIIIIWRLSWIYRRNIRRSTQPARIMQNFDSKVFNLLFFYYSFWYI